MKPYNFQLITNICMKSSSTKYWIAIVSILLASTVSYAQKEGNIWYFGVNAGSRGW